MNEDSDGSLVQRCRNGDRRAFELLVVRYEKPVFNAARRMLRNPDDAHDVAQTVFLKAFEHLDDYDPKFKFYSWIYRIALNESINLINGRRRLEPIAGDEIDDRQGAEDELASEQLSRGVQGALMTIKAEYRAVIVLKHFLDCSYEDIGEILQLPEKTVKSRLFSARQLLKDALQNSGIVLK
jgi:RNA polymerase sigma-70 factor (ECF subfamily)